MAVSKRTPITAQEGSIVVCEEAVERLLCHRHASWTRQTHSQRLSLGLACLFSAVRAFAGVHAQVAVTASIGVGVYPDDGADFAALLHHADQRMYAGKHPTPVADRPAQTRH